MSKGWRMLGWSYDHMERYEQAANAYAKAVELDPNSAELKRAYEEAKAKASDRDRPKTAAPSPTATAGTGGGGPGVAEVARIEAMPAHGA